MLAWVVIDRQQPRQAAPLASLHFTPLFPLPHLSPLLPTPYGHSYTTAAPQPLCNQSVTHSFDLDGGCTSLCGNYKSWPQIVRGQPLSHNMLWSRRTKTEYPHRLVHPPRGFNRLSPTRNPLSPFFSNTCALFCTSLHFFALTKNSTLLFSINCALFAKNTRGCGALLQPRAPRRGRRHAE